MRKSTLIESQTFAIFKGGKAEVAIEELKRRHGISSGAYFDGQVTHGGVRVAERKRVKELALENDAIV